ncbi:putative RNA-processing beta-lactamase [Ordospora colligata]|uniref:Putative RNA-processing beta-lactamase n=1 Tax=Ordospora colligata OC4 TaxID=1354746 RepID=A0A0B2UF95_9MICR|nr:putative RNA-processing beta-lactamase [Ordospora colligata OC4]KHN69726.1 putative RNA-processing beta-lactamase [Ordospora colligata OC4]TBU15529.1 putative RNA-processing beta-lactamase [Ordospora colligata]TBU15692.1 putative RNA-processing beta-lactamase [Ordospora colligata]TBU18647.1 putative RNA-processing beta-lactamase [Ordospora colligata]
MNIIPLGAGQDVGRSCIIATIGGRTIMFDCGMHMGFNDERRFPDFSYISKTQNFNKVIDCVIISHFHLDHCGALPHFTEICGYDGPIYMTQPTKEVCPILLDDFRKIVAVKGDDTIFTYQDILNCMKKVITINMNETYEHGNGIYITPYYAGHVLGAAMFHVVVGDQSVVYTGDYSTTPDKHLGPASIKCVKPDILITESTYGSVVRDCRKVKEREFLKAVSECVLKGGKVLIPIFALGRAQELCLLLDGYWERSGLNVPVYFSGGLTEKANEIYKRYIGYTNETIKQKIFERNLFDYKHIKAFQKYYLDMPGPMVLFASPGMLHSGMSLKIFKEWCEDEKNLVIIPGYCVRGTVGEKVLNGAKRLDILGESKEIKIQVRNLAFSAHADSEGILSLIEQCKPRNVMLVHGEKSRMRMLKKSIEQRYAIPTFFPSNGVLVNIPSKNTVDLKISKEKIHGCFEPHLSKKKVFVRMKLSREKEEGCCGVVECDNYLDDYTARDASTKE